MRLLLTLLIAAAAVAPAQENQLSGFTKQAFGQMKAWIVQSAEKMPEESYSFKPVDTVRSFGQILGHVADTQYMFCSSVLGEKNPSPKVEQTKTSKADLIAALKEAFAYCDKAYEGVTDANATEPVKAFGQDMAKLNVLTINVAHDAEHYGNLSTYLRIKGIVPPSSEPRPESKQKK